MRRWSVLLILLAGLACIHRDATIVVISRPLGAAIWLDGDSTGFVTPQTFPGLYAGYHWLRIGFSDCYCEDTFPLSPKETRTFEVELARRLWKVEDYSSSAAPPAIAPNGTVYAVTGYSPVLRAIAADGVERFQRALPPGSFNSIAIGDNGDVYLKSEQALIAYTSEGESLWSRPAATGGGIALGADGTVYSSGGGWLSACAADGVGIWNAPHSGSLAPSAPAVMQDGRVCVAFQDGLFAFDSAGHIAWACSLSVGDDVNSSLAIGPDGTIYVSQSEGSRLFAVSSSGGMRWNFDTGIYYAPPRPAVDVEGNVYFAAGSSFYALNPDGTLKWRTSTNLGGADGSTPAIGDNARLYCTNSYSLFGLTTQGEVLWQASGSSYGMNHVALADSLLVSGSSYGTFRAYRVTSTGPAQGWPMFQHDARRSGRAE